MYIYIYIYICVCVFCVFFCAADGRLGPALGLLQLPLGGLPVGGLSGLADVS